jgi:four helix bundle protein
MKFDLEQRLIDHAVTIINLSRNLPRDAVGRYLANQIMRSGISPALNYSEALGAESRKDFVHKIKVVLKELRETNTCLKIISRTLNFRDSGIIKNILNENEELISIFVKSIKTAQSNF